MSEDTCRFGHIFQHSSKGGVSGDAAEAVDKIRKGKITSLEELREEGLSIIDVMGDPVKKLKGKSSGQGTGYGIILTAADDYDEELEYDVTRVKESIYVSPQSQLHDEFMQRKQQAEQRIGQTMGSFSDRMEQKHLLEHDIRKLRSRAEAFESQDEDILKGDFVQLVDGAGSGGQGGDEQSLRFLRDNNIYPTIVADFMEMDSVDDLKKAENHDDIEEDGKLADLPRNEKAILRKKYSMYQKWKDMYGSEINRRLKDLKSQLRNIENDIENMREWLKPYVRDVVMINEMGEDQGELNSYYEWKGYSSLERNLEFICHKGMVKKNGRLFPAEGEEPTHYRIMHIHGVHVVLAKGDQPNQPGGTSIGVVFWRPAVVCKHVFENIFKPKIDEAENLVEEMHHNYVGEWKGGDSELKEKRLEEDLTVRELREKIEDELDEPVPIELSSKIRRVEDGLDRLETVKEDFSEDIYKALVDVLELETDEDESGDEMLTGLNKKLAEFTGKTDEYYIDEGMVDPMDDMMSEFRFDYYYDYKIGFGMHTMK